MESIPNLQTQRKIVAILRVLKDAGGKLGGRRIAQQIQNYGINLSERTVRYYLKILDETGLTENYGKRGRRITEAGKRELEDALVIDKLGLIASTIDDLSYKMNFSLPKQKGTIILNISTLDSAKFKKAIKQMSAVFQKNLSMGQFIIVKRSPEQIGGFNIPEGKIGIGTVCSVTINGVFLKSGIPVVSRFGGLLEIRDGQPVRFTEAINYAGSSLDPLEIFIKGKMTSVNQVVQTGNGIIGASFREIPAVAISEVNKLKRKMENIGLGGILLIGRPGQPLLDIPVPEGKVGMIVTAGLNPVAALEEVGIETSSFAMGTLLEFAELSLFMDINT